MHANTWKKISKVLVVAALCLMACFCVNTVKAQAAAKAKVVLEFTDGTKKTWKTGNKKIKLGKKKLAYVYFGEYPQTEVTGKALTKAITGAKYNKNGVATVKGVRYKRISTDDAMCWAEGSSYYYDWTGKTYAYFKYEPIRWRVLNRKNGTALIVSEYGLDPALNESDINRRCSSTDFAKGMGAWTTTYDYETAEGKKGSLWWLRSPGDDSCYAASVFDDGIVYGLGSGVYNSDYAVRPALNLNLSSIIK